jgi:hypothetical protein
MEYMMSYGWAILLIMMVGAVMWRLGIFDTQSSAVTSSGFPVLKPLLATCETRNASVWGSQNRRGFSCQFVNNAGTNIEIRRLNVLVDNKTCQWMRLAIDPSAGGWAQNGYWSRNCLTSTNCYDVCYLTITPMVLCPGNIFPLGKDNPFTVTTYNFDNNRPDAPCHIVNKGQRYEIAIEFTYDIDVGGAKTTKTETGKIFLQAE